MTHEEHKEAVALAALGEDVGPERADALEVHLAACGECRAELRELSDAAAMLAFSPEPVPPSPQLRSRILAEIKATREERAAADASLTSASFAALGPTTSTPDGSASATARVATDGRAATDAGTTAGAETITDATTATDARTTDANVLPFNAKRRDDGRARRRSRPMLLFGYLAASLAIAALSVGLVTLWQSNNQLRRDVARLSVQLEQTRAQLTDTRTELASARREAEMLSAPDSHVAELTGTEIASDARAPRLQRDDGRGRPRRRQAPAAARGQGLPTLVHRRRQAPAWPRLRDRRFGARPDARANPARRPPRGPLRRHA